MKIMKKNDDNLRKKLGYLRRAEVLYTQERYKEAFKTIVKAIKIVKGEMEIDEKLEDDKKERLREKLNLETGKKILFKIFFNFFRVQCEKRTYSEITAERKCSFETGC